MGRAEIREVQGLHQKLRDGLKALLYPTLAEERLGLEKATERLGGLFGADRVKEAIRLEAKDMNERRTAGTLGIGSSGALTALPMSGSVSVPRDQFYGT